MQKGPLLEEKGVIGKWEDKPGAMPPDNWDGQSGLTWPPVPSDGALEPEPPYQVPTRAGNWLGWFAGGGAGAG